MALPVRRLRDVRLEFRLKLAFVDRSGVSPPPLVQAQRTAFAQPFRTSSTTDRDRDGIDPVEVWWRHSASAIAAYLAELEARYAGAR
ncbi:MAG: hypothetical protein IT341_04090 [Chloroflexi bacterium]|nr:hypothetical protein [Chloroflexota bacterium]